MTNAPKTKLGILGIGGRMGRELEILLRRPDFASRFELVSSPARGEPFDSLGGADVIVEFSSPSAALAYARSAVRLGSRTPLVVGATGWNSAELTELGELARTVPILRAANFSLGILLCRMALGVWRDSPGFDHWKFTIRDVHHSGKKDAPSGTALALREALGREVEIESIREGDAVGTHEITLESDLEKISLVHEAKSRAVFAEGALETAIRLAQAPRDSLAKRLLGLDDLYLRREA